jgi:hypothetical protein
VRATFTLLLTSCIFGLVACTPSEIYRTKTVQIQPQQTASKGSVRLVSEKNLKNWKLVLRPDFSLTISYIGTGVISNEAVSYLAKTFKVGGAQINGKHEVLSFRPNPHGMPVFKGKVRVDVTWRDNGVNKSGYAIFAVNNTK